MASSKQGPGYARRLAWLAVVIPLAVAAYSAGWFYVARQIDIRAENALAALRSEGVEAICEDREVRGYPFRIGLFCDRVAIANPDEGLAFSAGEFRSAGQIYNPLFLIGELEGPARLQAGGGLPRLGLDWELLRSSVRLASPLPERLSAEGRSLAISTESKPLLRLGSVETHARPNGGNLDLAWRFEGLTFGAALAGDRDLPPLSGEADLSIADGVKWIASRADGLRGKSGIIRSARLIAGGASISVKGPVSVDEQGLIDAELQLSANNPEELSAILRRALPEFAGQIETALLGLSALGDDATLPLSIANSEVSIGFFPMGTLPPF